jgi:hypothetical protein
MSKPSFLALPGEIRNQIYEECLVLPSNDEIFLFGPYDAKPSECWLSDNSPLSAVSRLRPYLGLLQTCKQVHAEAAPMVYARNRFHIPDPETAMVVVDDKARATAAAEVMRWFVERIGSANAEVLTHLIIPFPDLLHHHDHDHASSPDEESVLDVLKRECTNLRTVETSVSSTDPLNLALQYTLEEFQPADGMAAAAPPAPLGRQFWRLYRLQEVVVNLWDESVPSGRRMQGLVAAMAGFEKWRVQLNGWGAEERACKEDNDECCDEKEE